MDHDSTWYEGRPRSRPHCVRWRPSTPPRKGHSSGTFRPISVVAKRSPISATAELLLCLMLHQKFCGPVPRTLWQRQGMISNALTTVMSKHRQCIVVALSFRFLVTGIMQILLIHSSNLLRSGVWLPALNNFCHSFLSSAVLLSATYFPFIRSLSRCTLFLPCVTSPLILPSIVSCSIMSVIHVLAHARTTRLRFLTVYNVSVLILFTFCRTSSLLILFTQLIFSILLQIHISMTSNLLKPDSISLAASNQLA